MKKKLVILTLSLLTAGMLSGCSLEEILGTTTEVTKTASSETDSAPSKTPSKELRQIHHPKTKNQ